MRQSKEGMVARLAAIPELPRAALLQQWSEAFGRPPPKGISRRLLEYTAAYRCQAEALGGLSPALRRKLQQMAVGGRKAQPPSRCDRSKNLPAGSRLVREWHGRTYTVDVLDSGFLHEGRHYRSLSEIARAITGARWSGPRFFAP